MEVDIVKYVLEGRCRVDDVIEWLTTVATPLPKVAASLNLGHGCNNIFLSLLFSLSLFLS